MRIDPADVDRLRAAGAEGRPALLAAGFALPGPRANLPLAHAAAEVAGADEARAWLRDGDEYLALCGALALAARADPEAVVGARDPRWRVRVREGVALGLGPTSRRGPAATRSGGVGRDEGERLGARDPVAADPVHGLPAFRALEDDPDPDVGWIVRSNRGKRRLAALSRTVPDAAAPRRPGPPARRETPPPG